MTYRPLTDQELDRILAQLSTETPFVFLETGRPDRENRFSYIFTEPLTLLSMSDQQPVADFFAQAQSYLDQGLFLAGWLSYEFGALLEPVLKGQTETKGTGLATFGVFKPPVIFDHAAGSFSGPNHELFQHGNRLPAQDYTVSNLRPNQEQADYLSRIERIKEYIAAGDTYQVNYTLKLLFDFTGSPAALYRMLRNNQRVAYGSFLDLGQGQVLSLSPELFFRKSGDHCRVRPMKGTMARGRTLDEDLARRHQLSVDIKNRSENVMIVDLLRNDLGRLSTMGSVEMESLFDVETYRTLHQMTSTISGQLRPGLGLTDLFKALFPCGSVTGAPKIRTMEIIQELESGPRGIYTGGIGFLSPDGEMVFNVPIRTVVLDGQGRGEMGIGSGIVFDSKAESEWRECLLKARFLSEPVPDFQLIETMLWWPGQGWWLFDLHMKRLENSARYFQFAMDRQTITDRLTDVLRPRTAASPPLRLRMLLHRDGQITLSQAECELPEILTPGQKSASQPPQPASFAATSTDSQSPYLFHKTTRRELYDRERQQAVEQGYFEVIFENEKKEITEGSISTILIEKEGRLLTPPLSCGLLPGIFREHLLQTSPETVSEQILFREDLYTADAVYMANSIRGLVKLKLDQ